VANQLTNASINVPELAQLHDIHLPAPISWWPLAPGWYIVSAFLIIAVIVIVSLINRQYSRGYAKRQALRELRNIEHQHAIDPNSQRSSAAVSGLLKRVALAYYPRDQVAGLQGEDWVVFLNQTNRQQQLINFNNVRQVLLEYPYQRPQTGDLAPLFQLAHTWIHNQSVRKRPCLN